LLREKSIAKNVDNTSLDLSQRRILARKRLKLALTPVSLSYRHPHQLLLKSAAWHSV
jgi:hypothetical protein